MLYIMYNKPTGCNSGSIVFIKSYRYALHVSDTLCVHRYMKTFICFKELVCKCLKIERGLCARFKIKRTVTQVVKHKDAKCTVVHRLMHFVHRSAWGK